MPRDDYEQGAHETLEPIVGQEPQELIVKPFNKKDIEAIVLSLLNSQDSKAKIANLIDLRAYGLIEDEEGLNIKSGDLFAIVDKTYQEEKPTIVTCNSGDYALTLNCSVLKDPLSRVPSYTFTAHCEPLGHIKFVIEKDKDENVEFTIE